MGMLKSNREPKDYKGWFVIYTPNYNSTVDHEFPVEVKTENC